MTNTLSAAITSGYYIDAVGDKISYKSVMLELFKYAKVNGYTEAIVQLTIKLSYINRRCVELQNQIDLLMQDMKDSSFSKKYEVFLSFIQGNADSDAINMPVFNTTNIVLSGRLTSLKNTYHELSVMLYKQKLFGAMITNLTQNRDSIDTIISEINTL